MFIQQIEVGHFAVFTYLVSGDHRGEGLVIDPSDDIDSILSLAHQEGIRIRWIVNTHAHVDHVMGNDEMKARTGAQIIIHEADAPQLPRIPQSMLDLFGGRPSPPADRTVKDGDFIEIGEVALRVLHTPGVFASTPIGHCSQAIPYS